MSNRIEPSLVSPGWSEGGEPIVPAARDALASTRFERGWEEQGREGRSVSEKKAGPFGDGYPGLQLEWEEISPGGLAHRLGTGSVALSALFSEWWEKAIVNCIGLQGIFLIPSVNYVNILRKEGLKQNTVLHAVKEVLFLHTGFDVFVHCMEMFKKEKKKKRR